MKEEFNRSLVGERHSGRRFKRLVGARVIASLNIAARQWGAYFAARHLDVSTISSRRGTKDQ